MIETVYAAQEIAQEAAAHAAAGPIGAFGITPTKLIAQFVNFGVVLLILWLWVYKPLLKVMNERTERIEKSLEDAKKIAQERLALEQAKSAEIRKAKDEAKAIIASAHDAAQKAAETMRNRATTEVEAIVAQAKSAIVSEREQMHDALKKETLTLATAIAEKILEQKMGTTEDQKMLHKALEAIDTK